MKKGLLAAAMASLVAHAGWAADEQAPQAPAAASPGATMTELNRSSATVTGQPLSAPQGDWEVVVSASELPAGGVLAMHKHPWPRYAYVERGRLRVRYEESGLEREFGPGEAVIEAVDQWHEGRVVGDAGVRIIVIDQLPRGQTNVVRR